LTNSRPSTPTKIMTAAGHKQVYHVATGPKPREAVAASAKAEPKTLAPAPESYGVTVSATGLQTTRTSAGTFTYMDGQLHSENDEPSEIWNDGARDWHRHGVAHRDGAPARIEPDGAEQWFTNGQLHRDGGPAITHPDGSVEFFVRGEEYDSAEEADAVTAEQIEIDRLGFAKNGGGSTEAVASRQSVVLDPRTYSHRIENRIDAAVSWGTNALTLDRLLQDSESSVRAAAKAALFRRERLRIADAAEA
jgi:hypothetical protein